MRFELKLGNVTYKTSHIQSNGKGETDVIIEADINGVSVTMRIGIEEKMTQIKVLAFIEAFHTAMGIAVKDQKLGDLQYGKRNIG